MTAIQPSSEALPDTRVAIWALLFGNLVIGTGVVLPIGLLDLIATDLGVTVAQAGAILLAGGLVVGIGAPVLAGVTSRIDRRLLLSASLLLFAAGHFATAFAPSLHLVVALRALTMIGAAVFTPQAASAVGLLVPPQDRARMIAFIFVGWSLASVMGLPAGRVAGTVLGWQESYLILGAAATVAGLAVLYLLPRGLRTPPLSFDAWRRVVTSPALMLVLAVTLCGMSGQFALFSYAAPVMLHGFGIAPALVAPVFVIIGLSGVSGNYLASRLVGRLGIETTVLTAIGFMVCGLSVVALGWGIAAGFVLGGILQGLGTFSSNSMQQSRLVALAPALASATVALNTSAVYLGQAVGSSAGALVMATGPSQALAVIALGFLVGAFVLSVLAGQVARRMPPAE